MNPEETDEVPLERPPGLLRRIASIFYDLLVLLALLTLASALVVLPSGLLLHHEVPGSHPAFRAYLLSVTLVFFCGFWVKGGQTIGMRAWRLRVVRDDGSPLRLRDALLRFFAATLSWVALGMGFLWILVDRDRRAWHDRLSRTKLLLTPKPGRR